MGNLYIGLSKQPSADGWRAEKGTEGRKEDKAKEMSRKKGGGGMKDSDVKIQGKEIEKLESVLENA